VRDLPILDVEPCGAPPCRVGPSDGGEAIAGVVGADVLSAGGRAARLDFVTGELTFFDGIAGSRGERGEECEAAMSNPFSGGGTIVVGGTEVVYPGRRPALGACLADARDYRETGTDVFIVLSTGIGQSLLAASAWDRLAAREELGLSPAAALPRGELLTPAGAIEVGLGVVPHLALVADLGSASESRGACRELQTNRLMAITEADRGCAHLRAEVGEDAACPCPDGDDRCDAASAVELLAPLAVAVLDDAHPLLQGLRDELRPASPELDGILALDALGGLRVDLDYPGNRILVRCLDGARCNVLPAVLDAAPPDRDRCARPDALTPPDDGAPPP
jgi:hypothetical protein